MWKKPNIKKVNNGWAVGEVSVPTKGSDYQRYTFNARVFEQSSEYGINDGRISKLFIMEDGSPDYLYCFDRGSESCKNDACHDAAMDLVEFLECNENLWITKL